MKMRSLLRCCVGLLLFGLLSAGPLNAQTALRPVEKIAALQQSNTSFTPVLVNEMPSAGFMNTELAQQVRQYALFQAGPELESRFIDNQPVELTVPLPGNQSVIVQLAPVNNYTPDYSVITSSGERIKEKTGKHYQGIVKGNETSVAAISVFDDEVSGFISTTQGNYVLGKLRKTGSADPVNIIYRESDLTRRPNFSCSTPDIAIPAPPPTVTALTNRCVRMYFETEVDIYTALGSNATSVNNYVNNLFNQVKTLYNNDGVSVALSQIFVWSTTDPYTGSSTSTTLSQFQATRTSFNGDVGQLLTTRAIGGGLAAVINGLCSTVANRLCVSGNLATSFPNVPTYSWTVMVATHEFGHLVGSRHTHACVWNGNNTAIDGCSGATEGGCALPGIPAGGGTLMSYCHLQSVGINFSLGFGSQPATVIRNTVEAASCLTTCSTSGCNSPTGLIAFGDCLLADLQWGAVTGATSYTVQYKKTTSASWISVNTTDVFLTLFLSAGNYNWRVSANCASGSSPFVNGTNFRVWGQPCPINPIQNEEAELEGKAVNGLRLVPQPATQFVDVSFYVAEAGEGTLAIYDQFGKRQLVQTLRLQKGGNAKRIDVSKLAAGMYSVRLQVNNASIAAKLLVNK